MKLRPFELALVLIFLVLAFVALFLLATYQGSSGTTDGVQVGSVSIWGTVPSEAVDPVIAQLKENQDGYSSVSYRYIAPDSFDSALTNALADGRGPDAIFTSHEKLVSTRSRIRPLTYETLPYRDIRSRYIDGAEIFALEDGVYALPVMVDPLMMYWNRDILATENFLAAPETWEELVNTQFPAIIERDFSRSISRSVVAMGEYRNVRNSFGIISTLLLQAGSQMVTERSANEYFVAIDATPNGGTPLRSVADFYTRFSQPSNALYSWNRAFEEDRLQFVAEELAFYFGFASEGRVLERINPNLNFDIAEVPQGANASVRRTYGKYYGLSLLNASDNLNGAYAAIQALASQSYSSAIAQSSNMVPVYRSSVAAGSNDRYGRVAYQSAGVALGWLNPNRPAVDQIFTTMTTDINENRASVSRAANDVTGRLRDVY